VIEFAPLFTLEVAHAYYDGRSPDFEFTAPSATERLLAGGHLLAKTIDSRLTVVYEKNTVQIIGRTLQFGLKLVNPSFSNFTVLPFLPGEGLTLYRNAGADPTVLDAPVALLLNAADPQDAELLSAGLFGVVEIEVGAGFYASPPEFRIAFEAREETLKYYVVARNYQGAEFDELGVSDAGFAADARAQIEFDRVAAGDFGADDLPAALLGGGDARVALFRSHAPVARRANARRRIQLARDTEVIISQLPQPGAAAPTADLVIHLSK
jgi:hypothetical protein